MVDLGVLLPRSFAHPASAGDECEALLLDLIDRYQANATRPITIGLCGAQGSGKSTMARQLARKLAARGRATAVLSLDDFYMRKSERLALARDVHPLLATRGVPGTHDIHLARAALINLCDPLGATPIVVPTFDKIADDRAPEKDWQQISRPLAIVIVEGWCVGARAQPASDLVEPINDLERLKDVDRRWRRYVNEELRGNYLDFFAMLDFSVLLRAPSFEIVHDWRGQQEAGLQRHIDSRARMTSEELAHFISHYERLTGWMHRDKPADLVIDLDKRRVPSGWYRGSRKHDIQW